MEKIAEYDPAVHANLTKTDLGQVNPTHDDFYKYVLTPQKDSFQTSLAQSEVNGSSMDPMLMDHLKKKKEKKDKKKMKKEKGRQFMTEQEEKQS